MPHTDHLGFDFTQNKDNTAGVNQVQIKEHISPDGDLMVAAADVNVDTDGATDSTVSWFIENDSDVPLQVLGMNGFTSNNADTRVQIRYAPVTPTLGPYDLIMSIGLQITGVGRESKTHMLPEPWHMRERDDHEITVGAWTSAADNVKTNFAIYYRPLSDGLDL